MAWKQKDIDALPDRLLGVFDVMWWERKKWYSAWDLQRESGQSSADVRARELRALGHVDWRRNPNHWFGAVDFRLARSPGAGKFIEPKKPKTEKGKVKS